MLRLQFKLTRLLLAVLCLLLANNVWATDDPEISTIFKGYLGEIVADPAGNNWKETIDDIYYDPNLFPTIANPNNDKITNAISLLINEAWIYKIKSDFTARVEIKIDYTLLNGTTGSIASQWLEINYTIAGGLKYNARQTIKFDQCRRVKVTIKSISPDPNTYGWNIWEVLNVENRMLRKRDYIFDNNTYTTKIPPTHTIPAAGADELVVNWSSDPQLANGKTHFDIEWTWVDAEALDNYKKADPGDNNTLKLEAGLLFKNNSSRITIRASIYSYAIPMIYDGAGQLFYRIRPVQYKEDGQVVNGSWSAELFTGISSYTRLDGEGHQENLNWQTTTSFAEDGKRKTVVQYFDGTLRGRQTVTKDNVSNKTVVAESFYDYQGRPAISILPAPTMNSVINFTEDFNKFTGTYVTPKDAFDLMPVNTNACSYLTPQLDKYHATGAAQYYSDQNPEKSLGINQFIPDANGYAYVETRYTPDATGRIEAQGGVGETFQLGKGNSTNDHDTKYFYGKPDQKELDALFGTEAGDATHYSKNMVRDANGQYSVSYVDMHGRTVATSLAGVVPSNVKPLDSYAAGARTIKKELITPLNNRVEGRSVISSTTLLVTAAGPHTFHYELTSRSAEIIACNPEGEKFCYDCYYDLEIRITGGCSTQIVKNYTNLTFNSEGPIIDVNCSTYVSLNVPDFTETLSEGEYNITKTLTVNKTAQDWYREKVFNEHNICKTLQDFYEENYEIFIGQSSCEITCEQCTTALGTYAQYRTAFLNQLGINPNTVVPYESEIEKSYRDAEKNCTDICSSDKKNTLAAIREAMMDDMMPDQGQYARLDVDLDEDQIIEEVYNQNYGAYETNTNKPFNIFNPRSSVKPPLGRTITPYKEPYDESGNPFYTDQFGKEDPSGVIAIGKNPQDFSAEFKQTWGKALIKYHPEYCKLQLAENTVSVKNSFAWDTQLENVNTWAEAAAAGYLANDGNGLVDSDPFFTGVGATVYKNQIKQYIHTNFDRSNVTVGTDLKTLWKLAWTAVFCINTPTAACGENAPIKPSQFTNPNLTCMGDWNYVWRIFRTLYLSEKDRMVNLWLDEQCPFDYNTIDTDPTRYTRRFGKPEDYYTGNVQTILDRIKSSNPTVDDKLQQQYDDNCESYKPVWIKQLRGCDQLTPYNVEVNPTGAYTFINEDGKYISNALIDQIITGLKAVCIAGSDQNHPMGSSTVRPGSTHTPTSFQQVINNVFLANGITSSAVCHLDLYDFPPPFDKQAPLSDQSIPLQKDPCMCNRLSELNAEKNADPTFPGGNLSQYLLYRHNITVAQSQIDILTAGCNSSNACTFYDPPLVLPAIFSCNTPIKNCIGCVEYTALKEEFKAAYPSWGSGVLFANPQNEDELNANKAFAKFMNNKTGFIKTWADYLQFDNACNQEQVSNNSDVSVPGCVTTYQKLFAGSGDDVGTSTIANPDGSIVFTGYTSSFGNGGYDGFIQKVDANGAIVWSKTYGGTGSDYLYSIKKASDGGYVAVGNSNSSGSGGSDIGNSVAAWMVKIDANGALQWDKRYSDGSSYGSVAWDVTITSDNGYAIAGTSRYAPYYGNAMVIKTDNSGTVQWAKSFDSGDTDQGTAISEDENELVIGASQLGQTSNMYDAVLMKLNRSNGNVTWARTYDIESKHDWLNKLTVSSTGYNFSIFEDVAYSVTSPEHVVVNTDKSGAVSSVQKISGPVVDLLGVQALTSDGGMIVVQKELKITNGDIRLIKISSTGTVQWAKIFGGTGLQSVGDVKQTPDGGYNITGYSNTQTTGSTNNVYVIKTDASGNTVGCTVPTTTATISSPTYVYNGSFVWETVTSLSLTVTSLGISQTASPSITTLCFNNCSTPPEGGPLLCGLGNMFPTDDVEEPCDEYIKDLALNKATEQYQAYLEEQKDLFEDAYLKKCLEAKDHEIFNVTAPVAEYQYTLYYYDQAGNLVKTVPPAGVQADFTPTFLDNVKAARISGTALPIIHNLPTQYRFNTLNQITAQKSPDGGESYFWYDILGRLVVSQNEKQLAQNKYSYTLYDKLGRITEVGEKNKASGHTPMSQAIAQDDANLQSWLAASSSEPNKHITKTVYDEVYANNSLCTQQLFCQQNLRNRVSHTYVQDTDDGSTPSGAPWETASFYTYDIHGNVDVLLQDYKGGMGAVSGGNRFKRIEYKYDLISGKVNEVAYQPGSADAFYHRYQYDAENKLIETWTSKEYVYWEREAQYKYYRHGPLARTVLGELEVQGVDYAYTLQGWLKGVNSTAQQNGGTIGNGEDCGTNSAVDNLNVYTRQSPFPPAYVARNSITFLPSDFASNLPDNFETILDPNLGSCGNEGTAGDEINSPFNNALFDMGQDGKTDVNGNPVITAYPDAYGNNIRTTDAYGYSLNYFNGDYNRISLAAANPFATLGMALATGDAGTPNTAHQLFNGNIGAILVSIPKLGSAKLYGYNYDQLNRITNMFAFKGINTTANTFTPVAINDYKEKVTYDANGNILTYKRNGVTGVVPGGPGGLNMDDLAYEYIANTNKLKRVTDNPANSGNYPDDIDNQADAENYVYDEIGNLIIDKSEKLYDPSDPTKPMIEWNVYGKISRITKKGDPFDQVIEYKYDAAGNRIQKIIYPPDRGVAKVTYYVRDAGGNVRSVYESGDAAVNNGELSQREIHLYGGSRLAVYNVKVNVQTESRTYISMIGVNAGTAELFTFARGCKVFELSNYLDNVLITVSDKKIPVFTNVLLSYYRADVITATDYYSFGAVMPGRKLSAGGEYRYGFNGKENDSDIKGEGNQQDYGMRIFDPRLGRFLSVDPLTKSYPMLTPYQFASNNPIQNIDIDGMEGTGRNGARTNTESPQGPWNLDFLKGKKESFENSNWLPIGPWKGTTLAKNMATSAWNQTVTAIEDVPVNIEFITRKHSREDRLNMLFSLTMRAVNWWKDKPYTKIETLEDIGGAFILSKVATTGIRPFNTGGATRGMVGNLRPSAIQPGIGEATLLNYSQGLGTRMYTRFNNVLRGKPKDDATKYLWTLDERGINIALEKTPPPGTMTQSGLIKHTNISSMAYSAGEVWFTGEKSVYINPKSARFGGTSMSAEQYNAAKIAWEKLGYKVEAADFAPPPLK